MVLLQKYVCHEVDDAGADNVILGIKALLRGVYNIYLKIKLLH